MTSPKVSVCIPVYNGEDYLSETIKSVLNQSFQDFEIVIVDNQSTDNTVNIIQSFNDSRIVFFQNETNIGLIGNWNMVMKKARGKYIKILPADDLIYPDCLKLQVEVFEKDTAKKISLVCGRKNIINESGKVLFNRGFSNKEIQLSGKDAISKTIRSGGNIIGEGAPTMFRREILEKSGYIDTSIPLVTDLCLWFKILLFGDLYCIPHVVGAFRICKSSNSVLIAEKQKNDHLNFIKQIFEDKRYEVSNTSYKIGYLKTIVLTNLKKVVYKYFL